ncbi:post-transcriptional regulator [Siminovitchia sediminis]|uniref:Post-transcriptional regulator n=2 Tax=Siminovitchia sediminis TaxID=1274353 RepID=A0ABW4KBD1_9BACI
MAEQKNKHEYDDYFHRLQPALASKVEEFAVLGYEEVSVTHLWKFLTEKTWKKPKEGIRIYELVSDILSLKTGDFMHFATMEAFRGSNSLDDLESEDLQELLRADKAD